MLPGMELYNEKGRLPGGAGLSARPIGAESRVVGGASMESQLSQPATNKVVITAEASEKEPGHYRATYVPREPGAYYASALITDLNGIKVAEVETGWTSEPLAKEFASLAPNRPLLEDIAKKTGGSVLTPRQLDDFVESLDKKKAPIIETYSYPLWHKPFIFLAALGCFISEWGVRRLKGLA